MRKPLIAGNWKMNGRRRDLEELVAMTKGATPALRAKVDLALCLPATLVHVGAHALLGSGIAAGGRDCHAKAAGAHTGDISAAMLFDCGASLVIVGHSERRTDHAEKDADVAAKARAAIEAGLLAVICVGETKAEREAGKALVIVRRQVRNSVPKGALADQVVVAYEPVWAIGTGLTPTNADIAGMHADIRRTLKSVLAKGEAERTRILYGGSVKPANAGEILSLADVDGALVGGASLKAADFLAIAEGA